MEDMNIRSYMNGLIMGPEFSQGYNEFKNIVRIRRAADDYDHHADIQPSTYHFACN